MSKPVQIKCPSCGAKNKLPRVYCVSCGVHLDVEGGADKALRKAMGRGRGKPRRRIGIRLLTLAVLACVGLMLWPTALKVETGTPSDAERLEGKLNTLLSAVLKDQHEEQVLTEAEINAYLKRSMRAARQIPLEKLCMKLQSQEVLLDVQVQKFGALSLSHIYHIRQGADGAWRVARLQAGHLPIPGFLAHLYVTKRMWPVWQKGSPGVIHLLENLSSINTGEGKITLAVGNAGG